MGLVVFMQFWIRLFLHFLCHWPSVFTPVKQGFLLPELKKSSSDFHMGPFLYQYFITAKSETVSLKSTMFYTVLCHIISYSLCLVPLQQGPANFRVSAWSSRWDPRWFLIRFSLAILQWHGTGLTFKPFQAPVARIHSLDCYYWPGSLFRLL